MQEEVVHNVFKSKGGEIGSEHFKFLIQKCLERTRGRQGIVKYNDFVYYFPRFLSSLHLTGTKITLIILSYS